MSGGFESDDALADALAQECYPEDGGPSRPRIISDVNRRQLRSGKDFILAAPDHVPAIFGRSQEVLWAEGESMFIVGPPAVGKGTLLQQAALRRAGVLDGDLIGFPVKADP